MDTNSAVAWAQASLTRLPLRHSTMGVPKAQLGPEKAGIEAAENVRGIKVIDTYRVLTEKMVWELTIKHDPLPEVKESTSAILNRIT